MAGSRSGSKRVEVAEPGTSSVVGGGVEQHVNVVVHDLPPQPPQRAPRKSVPRRVAKLSRVKKAGLGFVVALASGGTIWISTGMSKAAGAPVGSAVPSSQPAPSPGAVSGGEGSLAQTTGDHSPIRFDVKADGGSSIIIGNNNGKPEAAKVPKVKVAELRVTRNKTAREIAKNANLVEDFGASSIIDIMLKNEGTGRAVLSRLRFTCISYKEEKAALGGDDVLKPSDTYAVDLSKLLVKGQSTDVDIAHEIAADGADRLLVVATDPRVANRMAHATGIWQLKAEFVTADGIVPGGNLEVRIPASVPPLSAKLPEVPTGLTKKGIAFENASVPKK